MYTYFKKKLQVVKDNPSGSNGEDMRLHLDSSTSGSYDNNVVQMRSAHGEQSLVIDIIFATYRIFSSVLCEVTPSEVWVRRRQAEEADLVGLSLRRDSRQVEETRKATHGYGG